MFISIISSILLSVAYLISDIKSPILNSIKMVSSQADYQGSIIFDGFKYTFLFLFIIVLAISVIIFISIWLFTLMTKNIDSRKSKKPLEPIIETMKSNRDQIENQ